LPRATRRGQTVNLNGAIASAIATGKSPAEAVAKQLQGSGIPVAMHRGTVLPPVAEAATADPTEDDEDDEVDLVSQPATESQATENE
jgi:hypothetical protein